MYQHTASRHVGFAPASPAGTRARNKWVVLQSLLDAGSLSQADIARRTGLSRTTISSVVAELRTVRLVVDADSRVEGGPGSGAGRPGTLLTLDDSAGAAVGIDFGHTHVRVAVANLAATVLAERVRELDVKGDAQLAMRTAAEMVDEVIIESGIERWRVLGAGMGLPGPIDRERGMVGSPSILPNWFGIAAVQDMSSMLRMPVELDNDSNLGALAEAIWGAG